MVERKHPKFKSNNSHLPLPYFRVCRRERVGKREREEGGKRRRERGRERRRKR